MSLNTQEVFRGSGVNPTQPPASQPPASQPPASQPPASQPPASQPASPRITTSRITTSRITTSNSHRHQPGATLDPRSVFFASLSSPRGSGSTPSDSRHSHRHSEPPPEHSTHSSREPGASSRKRDADRTQEHPARGDKAQKTLGMLVPSSSQLPRASEGTPLPHANRAGAGQPNGGAGFFQSDTALGSAQLHRESGAFQPGGGLATVQSSGRRAAQASGWVESAQHTGALANVQRPRMFSIRHSGGGLAAAQPERRSENAQPGGRFGAAQHGRGVETIQSHPGFEAFASPSAGLTYVQSGAGRGIPPPRPPPGSPPPFRGGPGNTQSGRGFGDPQPPTGVPQTMQLARGYGVYLPPLVPGAPLSEAGTGGSPSRRASTAEEFPSGRRSGANRVSGTPENNLTRTQLEAGPLPGLEPFQTAGGRSQAVPYTNRQAVRLPRATGEVPTSRPVNRTASPSPNMTSGAATSQPATSGASPSQNNTRGVDTPQPGTSEASPPRRTGRSAATPPNAPGGTALSQPASQGASPSHTVARGAATPQQTAGAAAKSQAVTGATLANAEIVGIIEGYLFKMDKFLESAMPTPEALQQSRCLRQAVKGVREVRAKLEQKYEQSLTREARRIEIKLEIDDVKKLDQAARNEEKEACRKAEEARARREAAAAEAIRLEREHNAIGDSSSREGTPEAGPPGP
ncbi:hypothetical protein EPUS_02861 [Endocarpon pusillum Z07020]|uniref:Uncharacterized protein n=1 Tax=Endocarpon pusillum (strain Z07020 / HMAS-L-300199) TaxID=1263415 RepID=U1HTI6_ENDPU|nr:uncharacterized protein EPUS_02861 [Endocarpon pusillum Z07020]ERF72579.1 hypothetical protein EPUS_02861 [Endocarpon pusillum Z07020]